MRKLAGKKKSQLTFTEVWKLTNISKSAYSRKLPESQ